MMAMAIGACKGRVQMRHVKTGEKGGVESGRCCNGALAWRNWLNKTSSFHLEGWKAIQFPYTHQGYLESWPGVCPELEACVPVSQSVGGCWVQLCSYTCRENLCAVCRPVSACRPGQNALIDGSCNIVGGVAVPYKFDCREELSMEGYLASNAIICDRGVCEVENNRAVCLVLQAAGVTN